MRPLLSLPMLAILSGCAADPQALGLRSGLPGLNVARAALADGMPQVALNATTGLLAQNPFNKEALLVRADALAALSQPRAAEQAYQQLLAIDSRQAGALTGLGRLALPDDPAKAQGLFQAAVDSEPRNTIALNDLGVTLDMLGQHKAAQDAYRRALGADSRDEAAQRNLALSLSLGGNAAEGLPVLRQYADGPNATPGARRSLAVALVAAGDIDGARRVLEADLSPEQADAAIATMRAASP